jgi:hypothetical protein
MSFFSCVREVFTEDTPLWVTAAYAPALMAGIAFMLMDTWREDICCTGPERLITTERGAIMLR